MKIKRLIAGLAATPLVAALAMPLTAFAATTVVVTPTNTQGWSSNNALAETRTNGQVGFVGDNTAPLGIGALSLVTGASTSPSPSQDKAQYMHAANTPIGDVTSLSYSAKQNSASFADGQASYQLPVLLNGTAGFTTFVYEPYNQEPVGHIVNGTWQTWDASAGRFWSSKTVSCGSNTIVAGGGGAPFYTLTDIRTLCPAAVVVGFGVNVGSNNPNYNVEVDKVVFNDTTYDFEAVTTPTIISPANGSSVYSSDLTKVDWTDSEGVGVTYQYAAYSDAGYTNLVYTQSGLSNSEIATPGTPPGEYYLQVRANDSNGNSSAWSNDATNPYHITVKADLTYPADKDACKNDGWKTFTGKTFKNQGDCVSYVAAGGHKQNNKQPESVSFSSVKF